MKNQTNQLNEVQMLVTSTLIRILLLTIFIIITTLFCCQAQDIVELKSNVSFSTHIGRNTKDSIWCKTYNKNADTTFGLSTKEVKRIVYSYGVVVNYATDKPITNNITPETNKPAPTHFEYSKPTDETKPSTKGNEVCDMMAGVGKTFYSYSGQGQVNFIHESYFRMGLLVGYTDMSGLMENTRWTFMACANFDLTNEAKTNLYISAKAGAGYFYGRKSGWILNEDTWLPVAQVALGIRVKAFDRGGVFLEAGIGPPSIISAGLYF